MSNLKLHSFRHNKENDESLYYIDSSSDDDSCAENSDDSQACNIEEPIDVNNDNDNEFVEKSCNESTSEQTTTTETLSKYKKSKLMRI